MAIADDLIAVVERFHTEHHNLDRETVLHRPAPDRWSLQQVVGHLVDSAANNHQRFVRAQLVDSLTLPGYEQNDWVACQRYHEADWTELLDLWRLYNLQLARVIRAIPDDQFTTVCHIGNLEPVTLEFLVEDYLVHLKHHLARIEERLA